MLSSESTTTQPKGTKPMYLTEHQVAEMTGFALQTLRNWRFRGEGPRYLKVAKRSIRYLESDVNEFMQRNLIETEEVANAA